ncbi:WD40 repeat-like protein [Annulohypoxylon maeteangense]|uniref:WD40 repeat-like protein n=1 Tax=Annulohypoxylon maeteangense TaxID=1927788 RepID=UPI0020086749|nr:WD40 repeat-like protein [Annulohypoxylon maeteangense]KAI0880074.1 WD40 repeat-like protein [Annulohypoxylon maeteangense]
MDIHRCRFVTYPPSAINAIAFSYPTVTKSQRAAPVRLAIGRANGDIEIWNPLNGIWHQETTLHGGKDRSIDGLVWVTEPDQILHDGTKLVGKSRLFSIGYTSTVTEWDLEKGQPRKQASGMHGDIWCLAAQPFVAHGKHGEKSANGVVQSGKKLVAGTMDGSLVLYSVDDDDLRFDRILVRSSSKKTKMVSMAFQNRNVVVVGCSDSAIRVYDMRNGNILRKMTLGSDLSGGAKEIIVWSVKCINGRDIVSGDSTGQVCIWDGKTYTQAQRLQTHNQDVLSLAISADGSTIVSGGMDRRTVLYRKTSGSTARWGKIWHRRYHSHDVKTMASFEGHGMSVVVSGGPDASPIVLPLQEAGMENHRTLSHLPQSPPLKSAPKCRLIVSWWEREVHIWRLRKPLRDLVDAPDGESAIEKNRKLLARILIKGEANITSAAISYDGSLLVVSTTSDIKAFYLKPRSEPKRDELKISKVELQEEVSKQGATQVQVSPDGRWLCAVQGGSKVILVQISHDSASDGKPVLHPKAIRLQRIERKIQKHVTLGGLGRYDRTITHIAFSPDSKMLAVADLAGYIDTWMLGIVRPKLQNGMNGTHDDASSGSEDDESEADAEGLRWARNPNGSLIPKLQASPTVLSFSNHIPTSQPSLANDDETVDDYTLLTITARPQVLVINPTLGSLTSWSRRNQIARFPVEFRNIRDLVKGALWSGDRVWLYGNTFLFMLDLSQDLTGQTDPEEASYGELVKQGIKRKRGLDSGAGSKMGIGAAGPTKVIRQATGEFAEEIPIDSHVSDLMDEDETSQQADESESDDSDDGNLGELALLRGAQGKSALEAESRKGLAFWHTYKYRPILGIVPLSDEQETSMNETADPVAHEGLRKTLEVALVERPLWDIDMPDRYFGDGEWEK